VSSKSGAIQNNYFAVNNLDKKLEKYLNYDDGYFVELGANDGFTQSNTYSFEIKRGWSGVLIEPCLNLFLTCCRYRGNHRNRLHCNACVPFDYPAKYVDMEYLNLMTVARNLPKNNLNLEDHISRGSAHSRSDRPIRFGAEAKTLTKILEESEAPNEIDLLTLDVEGTELAVLGGLDFSAYKFRFILIESRDITALATYLESYGYRQIEQLSHHDYLFSPSP